MWFRALSPGDMETIRQSGVCGLRLGKVSSIAIQSRLALALSCSRTIFLFGISLRFVQAHLRTGSHQGTHTYVHTCSRRHTDTHTHTYTHNTCAAGALLVHAGRCAAKPGDRNRGRQVRLPPSIHLLLSVRACLVYVDNNAYVCSRGSCQERACSCDAMLIWCGWGHARSEHFAAHKQAVVAGGCAARVRDNLCSCA